MNQAPPTGTIDITDLVEKIRQSWVTWGVAEVSAAVLGIPGIGGFLIFIFNWFGKPLVELVFNFISKRGVMLAFFLNTAVRKASQAKDFTDAVHAKNSLPDSATKEEFANAENHEIIQFINFALISN